MRHESRPQPIWPYLNLSRIWRDAAEPDTEAGRRRPRVFHLQRPCGRGKIFGFYRRAAGPRQSRPSGRSIAPPMLAIVKSGQGIGSPRAVALRNKPRDSTIGAATHFRQPVCPVSHLARKSNAVTSSLAKP